MYSERAEEHFSELHFSASRVKASHCLDKGGISTSSSSSSSNCGTVIRTLTPSSVTASSSTVSIARRSNDARSSEARLSNGSSDSGVRSDGSFWTPIWSLRDEQGYLNGLFGNGANPLDQPPFKIKTLLPATHPRRLPHRALTNIFSQTHLIQHTQ
jgi:hypothetical protein